MENELELFVNFWSISGYMKHPLIINLKLVKVVLGVSLSPEEGLCAGNAWNLNFSRFFY